MPKLPPPATLTRNSRGVRFSTAFNALFNALGFAVGPRGFAPGPVWALANEGDPTHQARISALANGAMDDAGWFVIPYGDSRHSGKEGRIGSERERTPEQIEAERSGVIQRLTREDAVALVNDFKSTWTRIKRAVVGLPVYKGHPDAKRFEKRFPDKTPRGTIADMEAREEGLAIRPVLTGQGADDVDAGWNQPSPYWLLRPTGEEDEGGRPVLAPFKLLSLGLVPRGNIEGLSLVNAAEPEPTIMKDKLRKFLQSIGLSGVIIPAEDADETALANSLDSAETVIAALKTEHAARQTQIDTLTADKTRLESEKVALANSAESAESTLKTVRAAAAKLVVAGAVKAGKISAADATKQETALANSADFEGDAAKIDALAPKLRTSSVLGNLGQTGKEAQSRQTQILALVNAHMEETKSDYTAAYQAVAANPQHAALFGAQKKAEAS